MKPELTKQLHEAYPKLFAPTGRRQVPIHIECGDGWFVLVKRLSAQVQHHITDHNDRVDMALEHNARVLACRSGDFTAFDALNKDSLDKPFCIAMRLRYADGTEEMYEIGAYKKQPVVLQVKQKFGGLRFYVDSADDFINGAIEMAGTMSYTICDTCGNHGKVGNQDQAYDSTERGMGYFATRCQQHWGRQD